MKFLCLFIAYPEGNKDGNLYTDFVNELKRKGHEVIVVAPATLNKTHYTKESQGGILRVKTQRLFNVHPIIKGINNLLLPLRFKRAIRKYLCEEQFDWIITSTPPITFTSILIKLKSRYNCKAYLILRDIFPQNAKDMGMINNRLLFSYFRHIEKQLYKVSDAIGCMSKGNIEFIKKQDPEVDDKKLLLLPNWIKPENIKPNAQILEHYNLKNKFVAVFGGNFGIPQRVDFILDLASRVKKFEDIVFLLIGDGTEKELIKRLISSRNLSNVIIIDKVPRNEYKGLVQACDIGLVNLSEKFTIPNIPSRTLAYWEAGLPILAATDRNTDYPKILEDVNGGLCCVTGDIDDYVSKFYELYNNDSLRKLMGENGRKAVFSEYSVNNNCDLFLSQIS